MVLNVNGTNYDVTTFTGSYNDNTTKFATAANGGVMPWWGDTTLAGAFATAASAEQAQFGYPNNSATRGPYFAYQFPTGLGNVAWRTYTSSNPNFQLTSTPSASVTYAQAVLAPPTPVPAPLPILGALASFRAARRLRRLSSMKRLSGTAV